MYNIHVLYSVHVVFYMLIKKTLSTSGHWPDCAYFLKLQVFVPLWMPKNIYYIILYYIILWMPKNRYFAKFNAIPKVKRLFFFIAPKCPLKMYYFLFVYSTYIRPDT